YKKVDNLLFDQFLNSSVGFHVLASNDAAIANYGHELALNIRPINRGDFNWTFSINGALNRDVLLKLPAHYGGQFIRWDGNNNGQHVVRSEERRVGKEGRSREAVQKGKN